MTAVREGREEMADWVSEMGAIQWDVGVDEWGDVLTGERCRC
jgi:uncharacterized cupin superfamily protein